MEDVYEVLANALDRLPNGFPRTAGGKELLILKKIFSPEEAALAGNLSGKYETVQQISERTGIPVADLRKPLMALAQRGLAWSGQQDGRVLFRLAPFIVGIYEEQVHSIDHELAHLVEDYFMEGGASGLMSPEPAFHRVVPAQATVKSEWILPYDDLSALLQEAKTFHLIDCICRVQQRLIGEPCEFPEHVCLSFSGNERPAVEGDISQTEALALLERVEQIGLVHTVSNVAKGVFYVCNCCGCCCGILRGITEHGIESSVAHANYYAVIDPDECQNCGTCLTRCQVKAIEEVDGISVVDRERCIGCGLCVTGCPNDVARLERKPDAEQIHPPTTYADWEQARLANRGLN